MSHSVRGSYISASFGQDVSVIFKRHSQTETLNYINVKGRLASHSSQLGPCSHISHPSHFRLVIIMDDFYSNKNLFCESKSIILLDDYSASITVG